MIVYRKVRKEDLPWCSLIFRQAFYPQLRLLLGKHIPRKLFFYFIAGLCQTGKGRLYCEPVRCGNKWFYSGFKKQAESSGKIHGFLLSGFTDKSSDRQFKNLPGPSIFSLAAVFSVWWEKFSEKKEQMRSGDNSGGAQEVSETGAGEGSFV